MALSRQTKAHLAMFVFSFLSAGAFSLGSVIADVIAPSALTWLRFLFSALFLLAVAFAGKLQLQSITYQPWRFIVLGALFSTFFVLMFEALKITSPLSTSVIFTLTPLLSALIAIVLLNQFVPFKTWAALLVGAVGAIWVVFEADINAILRMEIGKGEVLFFIGCLAHAFYTPLLKLFNRGEPAPVFTFAILSAGLLVLLIYGWTDIVHAPWLALTYYNWLTIGYLSVAAGAITFSLIQYATLRLPTAKVMAYTYLIPSWVLCWEWSFGKPLPAANVLMGVALTGVALLLLLDQN